jgi:hypothetical protein
MFLQFCLMLVLAVISNNFTKKVEWEIDSGNDIFDFIMCYIIKLIITCGILGFYWKLSGKILYWLS